MCVSAMCVYVCMCVYMYVVSMYVCVVYVCVYVCVYACGVCVFSVAPNARYMHRTTHAHLSFHLIPHTHSHTPTPFNFLSFIPRPSQGKHTVQKPLRSKEGMK